MRLPYSGLRAVEWAVRSKYSVESDGETQVDYEKHVNSVDTTTWQSTRRIVRLCNIEASANRGINIVPDQREMLSCG